MDNPISFIDHFGQRWVLRNMNELRNVLFSIQQDRKEGERLWFDENMIDFAAWRNENDDKNLFVTTEEALKIWRALK